MLRRTIFLILLAIFARPALAAPALWQVDTHGGRFWLLGSIHVGKVDNQGPLKAVLDRLEGADNLVQELAPQELTPGRMQASVMHYGLLQQGSLRDQLSPKAYQALSEMAGDYGIPMAQLDRVRPWFAVMTLMQSALARHNFDANLGIDNQVKALAEARGWQISGLESLDRQFQALASSDHFANDMVLDGIGEMDQLDSTLSPMLDAWQAGKLDKLGELCPLNQGKGPAYQAMHDATLKQRNQEWVPKLLTLAQGRDSLVVVGLGHIICTDGLLSLLEAKGAKVQRLQ